MPKSKIPSVKVPSDECTVSVGQVVEDGAIVDQGIAHYVHKDEWIEIIPVMTVKEVVGISKLQGGEPGTVGLRMDELCTELSKRIISWNWTNMMGEPLAQPYQNPDVLTDLTSDELMWLITATGTQESADERKKDSNISENSSSEMEPSQPPLL